MYYWTKSSRRLTLTPSLRWKPLRPCILSLNSFESVGPHSVVVCYPVWPVEATVRWETKKSRYTICYCHWDFYHYFCFHSNSSGKQYFLWNLWGETWLAIGFGLLTNCLLTKLTLLIKYPYSWTLKEATGWIYCINHVSSNDYIRWRELRFGD